MKLNLKCYSLVVGMILCLSNVAAASSFNASLTPDIAVKSKDTKVEGLVIGIWSENPQKGVSLGFVNGSTGNSKGVSFALLGNYSDNYTGAHLGIVNWSKGHFVGAQFGVFNYTKKLTGVQFGLVNYAESVDKGLQIGLVNIISETTEWFTDLPDGVAPIFPFLNWRF